MWFRNLFLIGVGLILSGCHVKYVVNSVNELPKEHSIVLARTYSERNLTGFGLICDRGVNAASMAVSFQRYRPSKPNAWVVIATGSKDNPGTCSKTQKGEVRAYKVLPGKYRYTSASTIDRIVTMGSEDNQYVFEVKAGEAVYIGDLVMSIYGKGWDFFKMITRDNSDEALEAFERTFKTTGLKFTTRLARNDRFIVPTLPK